MIELKETYDPPYNLWYGVKHKNLLRFKITYGGSLPNASALPPKALMPGVMFHMENDGSNYMWNGVAWDKMDSNPFVGATSSKDGIQGLVPQPKKANREGFLYGGGGWKDLDASDVKTGVFNLARIPAAAMERLVPVNNQEERFALTTATVQNGDTVLQSDTQIMYRVVDQTELDNSAGYVEYQAARASVVPWSGILDAPNFALDNTVVHIAGNESITGDKTFVGTTRVSDPTDNASNQAAPIYYVVDMLRQEVERLSDGRNTIIRDINGNPNHMVIMPRFNIEDVFGSTDYGTGPWDCFILGDRILSELFIGKYHCTNINGKACSLPHANPWTNINWDTALIACNQLGDNFSMCPDIAYAAYCLYEVKHLGDTYKYHGNTNYGRDATDHKQTGAFATATTLNPGDSGISDPVTLTGSGPAEWYGDGTYWGLADLAGNINEWTSGLRIVDGEFQFIPNCNAMLHSTDFSVNSSDWKAVLSNGSLVTPGTTGTMKGDGAVADTKTSWANVGQWRINTVLTNQNVNGYYVGNFSNIAPVSGVSVPSLLVRAGIMPYTGTSTNLCNWFGMCNKGERFALRGSVWYGSNGPLRANLIHGRTGSYRYVGFRLAFHA